MFADDGVNVRDDDDGHEGQRERMRVQFDAGQLCGHSRDTAHDSAAARQRFGVCVVLCGTLSLRCLSPVTRRTLFLSLTTTFAFACVQHHRHWLGDVVARVDSPIATARRRCNTGFRSIRVSLRRACVVRELTTTVLAGAVSACLPSSLRSTKRE